MSSRTLRFKEVELTTLNKALLGRQPKIFDIFSFRSIVLSVFFFTCFFVSFRNRNCLFVCFQDPR